MACSRAENYIYKNNFEVKLAGKYVSAPKEKIDSQAKKGDFTLNELIPVSLSCALQDPDWWSETGCENGELKVC